MNINRLLLKINRFSAWALLVFMITFILTGYSWTQKILIPARQASYAHTNLDLYLIFFFVVHSVISIRFTLMRWRVGHRMLVDAILLALGAFFFLWAVSLNI
jgi:hypothetical protein